MLVSRDGQRWTPAVLDVDATDVVVREPGTTSHSLVHQPRQVGQDAYEALAAAAFRASTDHMEFRGCGNCLHFRFSGMARQMSGGRQGYCCLVGFRQANAVVDIAHDCGEFVQVPGWPRDLNQVAQIQQASDGGHPERWPAVAGALGGLGIADPVGLADALAWGQCLWNPRESPDAGPVELRLGRAVLIGLIWWKSPRVGAHWAEKFFEDKSSPISLAAGKAVVHCIRLAMEKRSAAQMRQQVEASTFQSPELWLHETLDCLAAHPHDVGSVGQASAQLGWESASPGLTLSLAVAGAWHGWDSLPGDRRQEIELQWEITAWAQRLDRLELPEVESGGP